MIRRPPRGPGSPHKTRPGKKSSRRGPHHLAIRSCRWDFRTNFKNSFPRKTPGLILASRHPAIFAAPTNVRYWEQIGQHMLVVSFTAFDPNRTFGAPVCCGAQRGLMRQGCDQSASNQLSDIRCKSLAGGRIILGVTLQFVRKASFL